MKPHYYYYYIQSDKEIDIHWFKNALESNLVQMYGLLHGLSVDILHFSSDKIILKSFYSYVLVFNLNLIKDIDKMIKSLQVYFI